MRILDEQFKIKDRQVGIGAINPMGMNMAGARGNMGHTQLGKIVPVTGLEVPVILTGHEKSWIHALKEAKVKGEVVILDVVTKKIKGVLVCSYIFFMDEEDIIDVIEVPVYETLDNNIAFKHTPTSTFKNMEEGDTLLDPVFSNTPSNKDGYNGFGVGLDVMFANINEVGEDAIIISESCAKKFSFDRTKTYTVTKNQYDMFKNIYGNDDVWKGFPDIGEKVRDDGILFDLFNLDTKKFSYTDIDNLRKDLLKEPSPLDNRVVYAKGTVTNIEVIGQPKEKVPKAKIDKADEQIEYYKEALINHKRDLCHAYMNICKEQGTGLYDTSLKFSPELGSLIEDAFTYYDASGLYNIKSPLGISRVGYNRKPIDTVIKITVVFKVEIGKGYKLSDLHGAKGIIGLVLPDKDMPCECILNPMATADRTIPSRLNESYLASFTRDVREEALQMKTEDAIKHIMGYFEIVSPKLAISLRRLTTKQKEEFLEDLEHSDLHVNKRFEDANFIESYEKLEASNVYSKHKVNGVVRIPGVPDIHIEGKTFKGTLYTTLLNNLPTSCMVTDSPRINALGLIPSTGKDVKDKYPYNIQASRILSEPETKIIVSYCSPRLIAELRDRVSSTERQRDKCLELLKVKDPANIEVLMDRKKYPYISGIGTQMMNSVFLTGGFRLTHTKLIKGG